MKLFLAYLLGSKSRIEGKQTNFFCLMAEDQQDAYSSMIHYMEDHPEHFKNVFSADDAEFTCIATEINSRFLKREGEEVWHRSTVYIEEVQFVEVHADHNE